MSKWIFSQVFTWPLVQIVFIIGGEDSIITLSEQKSFPRHTVRKWTPQHICMNDTARFQGPDIFAWMIQRAMVRLSLTPNELTARCLWQNPQQAALKESLLLEVSKSGDKPVNFCIRFWVNYVRNVRIKTWSIIFQNQDNSTEDRTSEKQDLYVSVQKQLFKAVRHLTLNNEKASDKSS